MSQEKTHYPIITISNFKRFNNKIKFELKPITILVGPNGSGKSTVIEAMDILGKSLFVFSTMEGTATFLNEYSFDELISDKSKERFEISLNSQYFSRDSNIHKVEEIEDIAVAISYKNNQGNLAFNSLEFERKIITIGQKINHKEQFKLKIYFSSFEKYELKNFKHIIESVKNELQFTLLEEIPLDKEELENFIYRSISNLIIYRTSIGLSKRPTSEEKLVNELSYGILANNFFINNFISDKNILALIVYIAYCIKKNTHQADLNKISQLCENAFNKFQEMKSKIDWIEPDIGEGFFLDDIRDLPPRYFTENNNVIDKWYHSLPELLLGKGDAINFLSGFKEKKEILDRWLSEFEIADKISITQVEIVKPNTKIYEITLYKNGKSFPLSSLSSGGKQIIPIILGCLNFGLAMYIRQPELHLHPKLQMKLADLFVYIKNEVQPFYLVIETHSEHMIRKFQLLVAKGEVRPNEIQVLYFQTNDKDDSTNLVELPLNDRGMFTKPWPNGFFEESATLNIQLIEEILSRKN